MAEVLGPDCLCGREKLDSFVQSIRYLGCREGHCKNQMKLTLRTGKVALEREREKRRERERRRERGEDHDGTTLAANNKVKLSRHLGAEAAWRLQRRPPNQL